MESVEAGTTLLIEKIEDERETIKKGEITMVIGGGETLTMGDTVTLVTQLRKDIYRSVCVCASRETNWCS